MCTACTFENPIDVKLCIMCGTSNLKITSDVIENDDILKAIDNLSYTSVHSSDNNDSETSKQNKNTKKDINKNDKNVKNDKHENESDNSIVKELLQSIEQEQPEQPEQDIRKSLIDKELAFNIINTTKDLKHNY